MSVLLLRYQMPPTCSFLSKHVTSCFSSSSCLIVVRPEGPEPITHTFIARPRIQLWISMLAKQFSNRIECSLDTYWSHALTEDYNRGFYADFLKYPHYKLLHEEDTGDRVHRRVQYAPPPPPGALTKVGSRFRAALLTEVLVFDKATRSVSIDYVPDVFASLMQVHADISCTPAGDTNDHTDNTQPTTDTTTQATAISRAHDASGHDVTRTAPALNSCAWRAR